MELKYRSLRLIIHHKYGGLLRYLRTSAKTAPSWPSGFPLIEWHGSVISSAKTLRDWDTNMGFFVLCMGTSVRKRVHVGTTAVPP